MKKSFMKMDSIDAYNTAFELSNFVWDIVLKWDNFSKFTVGRQLVESTDSISANVAEGFGRYHKKDKIKFSGIPMDPFRNQLTGSISRNTGSYYRKMSSILFLPIIRSFPWN